MSVKCQMLQGTSVKLCACLCPLCITTRIDLESKKQLTNLQSVSELFQIDTTCSKDPVLSPEALCVLFLAGLQKCFDLYSTQIHVLS